MAEYVNWPIATVIISVAAFIILRPALLRLLDRLKSASKEGMQFERPQSSTLSILSLKFVELMRLPLTPSEAIREKQINEKLQALDIKEPIQQSTTLARALAVTSIRLEFSTIANSIFGSQLTLLQHLTETSGDVPSSVGEAVFSVAKSKFPEHHTDAMFVNWIAYLANRKLLVTSDDSLVITPYGRDFLKYLIDESLNFPRYG